MNPKYAALTALIAALLLAHPAAAAPGDPDKGEAIYTLRCVGCHGDEGDGMGPAAERLNPPPRDFTMGFYKFRTTGFDDYVPNDADLMRMIRDGMPGTAMPGWGDLLSEAEMWDLIAYLKVFGGLEEEVPTDQVDYGEQVATSAESIAKGKALFKDRCDECHGASGKGVATKRLKDDGGARTWPRNLTKPWTFRASNEPRDIFSRISVGIPGTQMPSFADPKSKKILTIEERWHVANYVHSLAEATQVVRPENTVVKAGRVDGGLPHSPDDPKWAEAEPSTFYLVPQIIARERFFTPSNDTITVRALYDDTAVAILLEWDDRTRSLPGDPGAETVAGPGLSQDAVAVQLPAVIPEGMRKPYFGMGDAAHPVNIWHWQSGPADGVESVRLFDARGFGDLQERPAGESGLRASGVYDAGTWRVVMLRPLSTGAGSDIQFSEGRFTPIAFAAWDGSNGEAGSKHTMTTWYWLLLKPPTGSRPYLAALAVMILIAGAQVWWARGAARRRRDGET